MRKTIAAILTITALTWAPIASAWTIFPPQPDVRCACLWF